ncbi:hypothetical protein NIES4106_51340 [Fischerella sp. NIES-4106]|nr:hypothetical protein NIES4106_51340 [Fischerella sp. NIES-4106]
MPKTYGFLSKPYADNIIKKSFSTFEINFLLLVTTCSANLGKTTYGIAKP